MQEVERSYTEIIWYLDSVLIGYFQLSDMAASCFTTSDYDKSRYYTYKERYGKLY